MICANLLNFSKCTFIQTFYTNLQVFSHGYIRHIQDILQLSGVHSLILLPPIRIGVI